MITYMLVNVTIHHGGAVQHNPFKHIGGQVDEVKQYDVNYQFVGN